MCFLSNQNHFTHSSSTVLLQELNSRAQGEVSIRDALREMELWGAGAVFSLTTYSDTNGNDVSLIKDWRDLFNQVCFYYPMLTSIFNQLKLNLVIKCWLVIGNPRKRMRLIG